jgi:hypothetical protein
VAISLPLVALITALLPGAQKPTELGYVALLLGSALILGYLAALVRGERRAKQFLAQLGYRIQPESSIYAQTLYHLSDAAGILVELKDGRRVTGCPRLGPAYKDDGINELYIVYPEFLDDNSVSHPVPGGAGIIIPLTEVSHIVLSEDPRGGVSPSDAPKEAAGLPDPRERDDEDAAAA